MCHSLYPPWSTPLLFPFNAPITKAQDLKKYSDKKYRKLSEFEFGNRHRYIQLLKSNYPTDGGFEGNGFLRLAKDIQRSAVMSGFELIKNGKYDAKKQGLTRCQKFSCCHCLPYRPNYKSHTQSSQIRKSSYH